MKRKTLSLCSFYAVAALAGLSGVYAYSQTHPISGLIQSEPTRLHSKVQTQRPVSNPRFQDSNYTTGLSPYGIAAGDFKGDGNLDVVSTNDGTNTVSVLLNKGNGTFATHVDYTVGSNPTAVTVGDFNGDGKLDLAVWNATDGTVSILLGNGDGTFQSQLVTNLNTPEQADNLAVGDFNKDGKLDLVVTNFINNAVWVLLGNGDGTFKSPVSYPVAARAMKVAVADLRNDGKLDLVVPTWGSGSSDVVSVLLGNGDGTFKSAASYGVDSEPGAVVIADFNSDGKLDLGVANICGHNLSGVCEDLGTVSVLFGKGNGTFKAQTDYTVGDGPFNIAAADFNGDGNLDLAVPDTYDSTVTLLFNSGKGTFNAQQVYTASNYPLNLVAGQFSQGGVGSADLFLADWDSYNGDADTAMLNEAGTHVTLKSSPNPSKHGETVTFTATVKASVKGAGKPGGKVSFYRVAAGKRNLLGTARVANGVASFQYSKLPRGNSHITAQYSGNSSFNPNYDAQGLMQKVE